MNAPSENELERALRLAAEEPAHRPGFYQVLLDAEVLVLGTMGQPGADGPQHLEAGSSIQLQNWQKPDGSTAIPFFSSLEVLRAALDEEESYLSLPARSLFEITLGATLILNPRSDCWKEFLPGEVEHMLAGGFSQGGSEKVLKKDTRVLLGQPSDYPSAMVEALSRLFATHRNVKKAYLGLMHVPDEDDEAHLIVGVRADGDVDTVMREAGSVVQDTAPEGAPVDLFLLGGNDSEVGRYLTRDTRPFYKRGFRLPWS